MSRKLCAIIISLIMSMPEIDTGETGMLQPFKRVDAIDGEGRYVLALDPNVQFKKMYRWVACETVPGERPFWEEQLFDLIKGSKDYSSEGEDHSRNFELWNEERGHFVFNNKIYGISFGRGCREQRSIGNFAIADELFAKGIARGGALILDLERID